MHILLNGLPINMDLEKIMIVWIDDDVSITLDPFVDEIEDAGVKVHRIFNTQKVFEELNEKANVIDGIILDIMMPIGSYNGHDAKMGLITGYLLLKDIKKHDNLRDIPVIIFTIYDEPDVKKYAREMNIPFLKKQKTVPDELLQIVKKNNMIK